VKAQLGKQEESSKSPSVSKNGNGAGNGIHPAPPVGNHRSFTHTTSWNLCDDPRSRCALYVKTRW
jgi:hypothetical protein